MKLPSCVSNVAVTLEEATAQAQRIDCAALATPYFSQVYGAVNINGSAAPPA
jgi:hypothetical protein